jgi:hypothetical protein
MGEQLAAWFKDQGEYVTGALFGLITLDIFMFLVHIVSEGTTEGYGLTTLLITLGLGIVVGAEKLYMQQEAEH